jgi:hypothetical protein
MKPIGLMTQDPRTYFEMIEALREQGLKYISLEFSEPLPANVGVVITTEREKDRIDFDNLVTDTDPDIAIARARKILAGDVSVKELAIGIDPGHKPGVAALGDGSVLTRSVASSPEAVRETVDDIMRDYPSSNVIIRIGNGDRTNRNRIFNALWDDGHRLEIVDERNTTTRSQTPDEDAAVEIALTPGYRPCKKQKVEPCEGEIRNIQRISRLESSGSITVSRKLAERVAMGELSLGDAIDIQKTSNNSPD